MKRLIIFTGVAFICAAAVLLAQGNISPAQGAVNPAQGAVNQEPHHKRLLYTNDLRMFDVVIPPGESAGDHVHEYDMASLVLGEGMARVQRNGADVTLQTTTTRDAVIVAEHTGAPATYRIGNTGTTDYHVIEVENLREGGGWPASRPLTAPGTFLPTDTRAFTIYDVRLNAGTPQTMHAHTWPTVVILVEGAMENGGIGGEEPVRLQKAGQWMFLPRGLSHTVSAIGGGNARIVEIEVR